MPKVQEYQKSRAAVAVEGQMPKATGDLCQYSGKKQCPNPARNKVQPKGGKVIFTCTTHLKVSLKAGAKWLNAQKVATT